MYNIEQAVLDVLNRFPPARESYNNLCFTYWIEKDGLGRTLKDFRDLTPLETICREARKIFAKRPDLSPKENPPRTVGYGLFQQLQQVFPGIEMDAPPTPPQPRAREYFSSHATTQ